MGVNISNVNYLYKELPETNISVYICELLFVRERESQKEKDLVAFYLPIVP